MLKSGQQTRPPLMTDTFNILHIISNLRKGGAERLALDICIELSKRDKVKVCLVALSDENAYANLSGKINYKVIPSKAIPSITGKPTVQIDELMSFIESFQPDVIHSHLFEADLASRWEIVNGVKYFSHCHDNMHQLRDFSIGDFTSKQRITELFEKRLICKLYKKCNNRFIAISNHTKAYFEKSLPFSLKNNISLLHNAIDYEHFYCKRDLAEELVLINTGSFVPKKNQQLLISVVKVLRLKGVNCRAVFLGDGSLFDDIKKKIDEENLSEYFCMLGNVSNVAEWLRNSSIYVHTASYEPLGLVLLEAMASGLPVVTLNGGGNADLMENGKNGFIIDEQDPELFAEKIIEIWENKKLYKSMSDYAQGYAKRFDIKEYVDKLLDLYEK